MARARVMARARASTAMVGVDMLEQSVAQCGPAGPGPARGRGRDSPELPKANPLPPPPICLLLHQQHDNIMIMKFFLIAGA